MRGPVNVDNGNNEGLLFNASNVSPTTNGNIRYQWRGLGGGNGTGWIGFEWDSRSRLFAFYGNPTFNLNNDVTIRGDMDIGGSAYGWGGTGNFGLSSLESTKQYVFNITDTGSALASAPGNDQINFAATEINHRNALVNSPDGNNTGLSTAISGSNLELRVTNGAESSGSNEELWFQWTTDNFSTRNYIEVETIGANQAATIALSSLTPGQTLRWLVASTGPTSSATIDATTGGLRNFDVIAINKSTVVEYTVPNRPAVPTGISITPGNAQLSVDFTPPSDPAGAAVTTYEYSTDGGTTWRARASGTTASPLLITTISGAANTALVNGQSYNVQIRAVNAMGAGTATSTTASTPRTSPTVTTTTPVTTIAATTATLGGNITATGGANATERGVFVSTSEGFADGTGTKFSATGDFSTGAFTVNATGLTGATVYYFKAFATNPGGTSYGAQGSFTTSASATAPIVSNGSASSITTTTATIAGEITDNGGSALTERGFVWSTSDSSPTIAEGATKVVVSGTTTGSISQGLTSLTPGTTYYYNTYAINGVGTSYGTAASFITVPDAPSPSISNGTVTTTGFTVSWSAVTGAVDYRIDVSTSNTFAQAGEIVGFTNLTVSGTSQAVTGLTAGTTYYVRVRAVNGGGTSAQSSTVTQITVPPQAATPTVSSVAANSFTANWTATTGAASYLLDVSTVSNFASFISGYNGLPVAGTSQSITGLTSSTTYYVRVRAVNTGGTGANSATLTQATLAVPDGRNPTAANATTAFLGDDVSLSINTWQTDGRGNNRSLATLFGRYNNANLTSGTVTGADVNPGASQDGLTVTTPRFNQTGDFYWAIRVRFGPNDFWFDASRPDWSDLGLSSPSNSPLKIVVSALNNPTSASAAAASSSSINLTWAKGVSGNAKNTMIVRSTDNVFTAPTPGTAYAVGNTDLGGDRVIYNDSGTSSTDTGLAAGTTYYYRFYSENYSYYSPGDSAGANASVATTGTPSITIGGQTSATATAFTTTYGTASTAQTFTIAGSNLTANITATAPTGFEVSSDGTSYGSTATFTQSSGSVSNQTLHVRLAATATVAGTYNSQNITLTSTDATTRNITTASNGNAVNRKAATVTAGSRTIIYGLPKADLIAAGANSYSVSGLVNDESPATAVTGTAVYNSDYVQGTDVAGTQGRTVTVSGLTSANYQLSYAPGTLTIDPIPNPSSATVGTPITHTSIPIVTVNSTFVLIVRNTSDNFTAPTPGQVYNAGDTIGAGTVVRKASAGTFTDTGLAPATTYYYKVYAEYYNYYSSGAVTVSASTLTNYTYNVDSGTTTVATTLTGPGSLTKSGNGELLLTANDSTYSGGTVISAGTLRINHDRGLGAVPTTATANSIQIGAATLGLDGTITLDSRRGITLTGGTAIIDDWGNGGDIYNGIIASANSATTSLTKNGGGNLTLGGNSSYTGLTTVNNGTLTITHANALGATGTGNGTTVTANDALRLSDGISVGNEPLELAGTGVGDTGALRSVSGVNSWGGAITLASNVRINTDADTLTVSGGVTKGSRVLFVGGAGNTTINGAITGAGASQDSIVTSIYKNDAGTLTLGGANTYTGATRIVGGNLTVSGSGTLGSGSTVRISSGATLTVNANATVAGVREADTGDGGTVSIGNGVTLTVNGANLATFFQSSINGAGGNLTFSGTGNTILSLYNAQGYSGTTTVSSGILTSSGAMSTATVNVNGGTFRLTGGGTAASANISIASGGTFDVAQTTSGTSLGASKVLTAAATGANTTGTITVASGKDYSLGTGSIAFSQYGGGSTAPLTVSGTGGNLNLNSRAVSVTSTTQLAAGTYKLIAKSGTANVTGAPSPTSITVGGSGSVGTASLAVTSGELILTVTAPTLNATTLGAALSTTYGTASAGTSFVASGTGVAGNITVTAQSGFEVSTSQNSGYGSSVSVASGTTVWVRVASTRAAGALNSTTAAVLSADGVATNVNVTTSSGSNSVAQLALTGTFTASSKEYDGTSAATVATRAVSGKVGSDDVNHTGGTATFSDANAGDGKTVTLAGATLTGAAADNYTLSSVSTTTANITQKALTGSFTANNKAYDGTTAATVATRAVSGKVGSDDVNHTGGTATFADANVGTGKTVTLAGATLTGAAASNYSLGSVSTTTANITAKGLTVTGLTGANKVYDRTTAATATGTAALSGVESGDTVTLTGTPTFTFASANVGTGISISTTGYTLGGAQAANYSLTQPTLSANITAKGLTVTGLTGANKVYDRTTDATATGTAALSGVISGDTVTLTGTPTFTFASANVATGISISTTGYTLAGGQAGNYSLTQPTLSANITAKGLTVTGLTGANKVYDGTTAATATGTAALSGVISGDTVTLTGTPTFTFASANVGTGISISTTGYTLGGAQAGNYSLTQPTGLTANITPKALTLGAPTLTKSKAYDGNTTAAVTAGSLTGVESGDTVNISAAAVYDNKNVGTGKTITVTYTLSGASVANYTATEADLVVDGAITPRALSITAPSIAAKTYDGTATAGAVTVGTLSGFVGTETVSATATAANYSSANAGTYNNVVVTYSLANGANGGLAANYSLANGSATGVVNKATPTITAAPTASAINEGQALSASNLSGGTATGVGGGALGGEFTFTSPGTTPAVGTASQSVTFTPTDTTNYNTATTSVSVTVNSSASELPAGTKFNVSTNGVYTVVGSNNLPIEGATFTYLYTGRTNGVTGLNTNYAFMSYSNTNAPTQPGFYKVTATAGGSYTGTLTEDYGIAGPLHRTINLTRVAGTATNSFSRALLMSNVQRVTMSNVGGTNLPVLATGPTGLSWTNAVPGLSTMQNGATNANAVIIVTTNTMRLIPANSNSVNDTFGITISDGATPIAFPAIVTTTNAQSAPTLTATRVINATATITNWVDGQSVVTNVPARRIIFMTRPGRTINVQFMDPVSNTLRPITVTNTGFISHTNQPTTNQLTSDNTTYHKPVNFTPPTGVLELMVDPNLQFYMGRPTTAPTQ